VSPTQSNGFALPQPQVLGRKAQVSGEANPVRSLALWAVVGLIFVRYSLVHEVLMSVLGVNTYLLYILGVPALIGTFADQGLARVMSTRIGIFWVCFTVWMFISLPFSIWPGGSFQAAIDFLRTNLPMLFVMGGLALRWVECRRMIYAIGIGGLWIIVAGNFLQTNIGGERVGLEYGIISNPNDFAAHLILVMPLVFYLVIYPPRFLGPLFRLAAIGALALGLYLTLATASRGAVLAMGVGSLFALWYARPAVRFGILLAAPVVFVGLLAVLPKGVIDRLSSLSSSADQGEAEVREALGSSNIRQYLLEQSVKLSFTHPLFGVGIGQFGDYMGRTEGNLGGPVKFAAWRSTHNSFTQISSEMGLIGLFFYLTALILTYRNLLRAWKKVRKRPDLARYPDLRQIPLACYCLLLSYVGFCAAIFFLNFGYFFYLPAISGLVIALTTAIDRELSLLPSLEVARPGTVPVVPAVALQPVSPPVLQTSNRFKSKYRFGRLR
jgi:O-antigen ligase